MLKSLYIKNYALIEDVSLDFSQGFTTITGETGAGKSILLGALSLLLGKRADFSVLRDSSKKCIVEGSFDLSALRFSDLFLKNDLDYEELTLIRREIIPSGRSRAFVNDTPVNLGLLKILGDKLINVHSQNDTLEIGKSLFQMQVLDGFIENEKLLKDYSSAYSHFVNTSRELKKLIAENENFKKDEDYFRFQFDELKAAQLIEGEEQQLNEKEKLLANAEDVLVEIALINNLLNHEDQSLPDKLSIIQHSLSKIGKYHSVIDELIKRVESMKIELEDIADEIEKIEAKTELNPGDLNEITERLDTIYRLQQKHNVKTVKELLEIQAEFENRLNRLSGSSNEIDSLNAKAEKDRENAWKTAIELHKERSKAAIQLSISVKSILTKLGMKNAGFEVVVNQLDELNEYGQNKVNFLFNANGCSNLKEISNVASGGELSRLMLAIKSLITKEQLLPTVIFDEIDSGVSGEVAGKVGNILKNMASHHQIIAITHLPQIASKSDEHFKVFKIQEEGKSRTRISLLDKQSRISEIAKLLSDEKVSDAAIETAKELLKI